MKVFTLNASVDISKAPRSRNAIEHVFFNPTQIGLRRPKLQQEEIDLHITSHIFRCRVVAERMHMREFASLGAGPDSKNSKTARDHY